MSSFTNVNFINIHSLDIESENQSKSILDFLQNNSACEWLSVHLGTTHAEVRVSECMTRQHHLYSIKFLIIITHVDSEVFIVGWVVHDSSLKRQEDGVRVEGEKPLSIRVGRDVTELRHVVHDEPIR